MSYSLRIVCGFFYTSHRVVWTLKELWDGANSLKSLSEKTVENLFSTADFIFQSKRNHDMTVAWQCVFERLKSFSEFQEGPSPEEPIWATQLTSRSCSSITKSPDWRYVSSIRTGNSENLFCCFFICSLATIITSYKHACHRYFKHHSVFDIIFMPTLFWLLSWSLFTQVWGP